MRKPVFALIALLAAASAFAPRPSFPQTDTTAMNTPKKTETAVFAGGCFWCLEAAMETRPGVAEAVSGYTGGHDPDPTYAAVSTGSTGHVEAVRVVFDPDVISYEELARIFFRNIDPTDPGGQFADRGSQYRTGIFPANAEQERIARSVMAEMAASGRFPKGLDVPVSPLGPFYPAEAEHQDYFRKHTVRLSLIHI